MAIQFSNLRYFATPNVSHMFYNVPVASQSFKLRLDSPAANFGGTVNILVRNIFDFVHSFWGSATTSGNLSLQLNGVGGSVSANIPLTVGTVYVICLVWDGTNGVQTAYINGVPQILGHISGLTNNRIDPIWLGPYAAQSLVTYTIGDYNAWDNYGLTSGDAAFLTNNGDPTTIGTGAPWRCQWTMAGTTGVAAAVGDNGLKNFYGTGADFASVTGSGTATYADPLVWAPTVTPHPYVTGCGKSIATTFTLNTDGSAVVPSQLLTTPTINVNGTDLGALTNPWFTGFHWSIVWSTPGNVMINPGDVVILTAPPAWANTPSGSVGALSATIDNRSGRSSVQVESLSKTLRMGFNHPSPGGSEYYPFLNTKFKTAGNNGYGKFHPGHGFEVANQPCEAGKALLVWDATHTGSPGPAMFSLQSNNTARVTVTHDPTYDVSPSGGVGYVRAYDISYVASSDYKTAYGGCGVGINCDDPSFTGTPNYDNLWIYLPGEWDAVNGSAVFDRSDQFALSRIYLDRVRQSIGSMRAVDMTACGGACETYPYPELLIPDTQEFWWGFNPVELPNVGFTSIGPVDVTATPWFYSAQFRQSANLFSATLTDTISTTPAVGTNEVYHFSDAATAPLMAGLEIQIDSEIMRVISVTGTAVTLYRGSNGTTPAPHSPGTVTVFGRVPISNKVSADGTAPFTAPLFMTCNQPHGMTTLHGYYPQGVINITMADGTVANNVGLSQIYVTGPTTFVSIWSGYYPSKPSGTKPSTTYTLDPASTYILRWYFPRMPLDVYIGMVARFPHANLHINIPKDACDDMVYAYAWKVRDGFPAGRKIYVEHQNEPWNFSPPFQAWLFSTFMTTMAVPSSLIQFHDYRDYYIYRAIQVHKIFRDVFTAAGRGSEIMGTVNCQMNNGPSQVTPYLNFALAQGQPLDAVACAPYYSLGMSGSGIANTVAAFNACDDDQAAEMVLHDITYDSTGMVTWIKSISDAVTAYNQANGKNAIMIGYEGNLEWASPNGSIHHDERSHDIQYNPNYYHAEQGWYKILQDHGFQNLHKYGIGIGWPLAWGDYHVRTQKHSLGDGLNGAANNRHFSVNPSSPFYVAPGRGLDSGTMLDQDIQVDSVRGQAFIDWNAGVGASAPTFSGGVKLGGVGPVHGFYTVSAIGGISDGGVYTQGNSLRWAGGERLGGVATYSNALNVITSGGFRLGGTIFRGSNYFVVATGGMSEGGRIIFGPVYRTFLAALTVTIQLSPQLKALYGGVPRVFTTWPGGKVALPFILIENYVESQPGEAVEHNRIFVQLAVYGADETTVRRFGRALQDTVDSPNQNRRSTREPLSWMTGDEQGCNRQPTTPPIRTGQKFYGTDLFRWGLMYQFEFVPLFQL